MVVVVVVVANQFNLFQPKTFYKYLFLPLKASSSFINDSIYDIEKFFNFHAKYVKAEKYLHASRLLPYF